MILMAAEYGATSSARKIAAIEFCPVSGQQSAKKLIAKCLFLLKFA